jgi:hypothetical protein
MTPRRVSVRASVGGTRKTVDLRAVDSHSVDSRVQVCDLRFAALRASGEMRDPSRVAVVDVADAGDATRAAVANRIAELFDHEWQLDEKFGRPTVVITVAGGAQNFKMPPRLDRVCREGLVRASQITNAWIFTGGSASGVMAHVGEALANHPDVPCIGCALLGNVLGREAIRDSLRPLAEERGHPLLPSPPVSYGHGGEENGPSAGALEPHHSHFVRPHISLYEWRASLPSTNRCRHALHS